MKVPKSTIIGSVSDPYHFDADTDPDPRIRFRDDGSGSGSGSDLKSNKLYYIIFLEFWLICMRVYHDFFWYPDPHQRLLMRIRPNDTDPTGSETLIIGLEKPVPG